MGKKRNKGAENIFKETMAKNSQNFMTVTHTFEHVKRSYLIPQKC
jgi:hypothetical protein